MEIFQRQSPLRAFEELLNQPDSMLIDCRTRAEWVYVGVPVLPESPQKTAFIEWVDASGRPNPDFLSSVSQIVSTDTPLYLICRSGVSYSQIWSNQYARYGKRANSLKAKND